MGLLAFLSSGVFFAMNLGQRSFQVCNSRVSLQNEALQVSDTLTSDLGYSSLASVGVVTRSITVTYEGNPTNVRRDGVCFVGVDDRGNPANESSTTARPIWNSIISYYASTAPEGSLIRQLHQPANVKETPSWPFFTQPALMNDDPSLNLPAPISIKVISRRVVEFSVVPQLPNTVFLQVRLRELNHQLGTSANAYQQYELRKRIALENTLK